MTTTADELHRIWCEIHEYHPPRSFRDMGWSREVRALTDEEWELVKRAVREEGFVATIESSRFGFSFALTIFEPHAPVYPGIPKDPRVLISITAWQVPGNNPGGNVGDQKHNTSLERGEPVVFRMFEEIACTAENIAACEREGIDPPKPLGHYQY